MVQKVKTAAKAAKKVPAKKSAVKAEAAAKAEVKAPAKKAAPSPAKTARRRRSAPALVPTNQQLAESAVQQIIERAPVEILRDRIAAREF